MIGSEAEYQQVQGEMRRLRDFLSRVEQSPEHPNKELSIVGIYKRMFCLWAELEEYYRARVDDDRKAKGTGERAEAAALAASA